MKSRFIMFRRAGVFYCEDTTTGKQTSLRTKVEAEAITFLNTKNEATRQPAMNLQIAQVYLQHSDTALASRTWQNVMDTMAPLIRKAKPGQARLPFALYVRNDNRAPRLVKLIAHYHLNEGGGTVANDATGNGHTGTLMNGASWTSTVPPALGASALLVGPAAGTNSVVLRTSTAWTATTNASWLHLKAASGTGSTNAVFSFDANTGATRSGTLTISGLTLTVTQAGSSYIATAPLTSLISTGLDDPTGVAVDGAGNVYVSDFGPDTLKEWSPASNTVTTLVTSYWYAPEGAAVDGMGNVYTASIYGPDVTEWLAASETVATLSISGLAEPNAVAVDGAANVYVSDLYNKTFTEWSRGSGGTSTLASGLNQPTGVAVDGAGNVYISDGGNNAVYEWLAASNTLTTLPISGLQYPNGVAVDGSGNVYIADDDLIKEWSPANNTVTTLTAGLIAAVAIAVDGSGNVYMATSDQNETPVVEELQQAFVVPTAKSEGAVAGTDVLPVVLPATENLLPPFVPTSSQSWLTITGVTNGVVSFAFTFNTGAARTGYITLLGQNIPVNQAAAVNSGVLGATNRLEGPAAGSDSVVLASPNSSWTATANASWLHLSAANQFGLSSTNVSFSFDANTGATRTGTLTVAGQTLTVTQAGTTYIAAPGPLTALVSAGLNGPSGVAVDGAGNVYFADSTNNAIKEWSVANNTVTTLVSSGLNDPFGVALDGLDNVYFADSGNNAIKEWSAASHTVSTLVSSGLKGPAGVAVDGAGNVYFADSGNNAIKKWLAASNTVTALVSSGLNQPYDVAVDFLGNVYIADTTNNAIKEWSVANNTVTTLVSSGLNRPYGVAVDGAGDVYFADSYNNAIKEWSAASNTVSTLVSSGLNHPYALVVDGADNLYIADILDNAIKEQPRAYVDPTAKVESAAPGSDTLPVVLPATENLLTPFAPTTNQPWLSITGVANGVVNFAFTANTSAARTANLTLLGQNIQVTQQTSALGTLGTTNRLEGPAAGLDSVILISSGTWAAAANASWLHLSAANQSGTGNTNVGFSFDANTGATRTGTLTIAGQTLTVTQAGSTYVAAPGPPTALASATDPLGLAVDGAGNVYFADINNDTIQEWLTASNTVITLVSNLAYPYGVAVDGLGNVYFADYNSNAIKEWSAASHTVAALVSSGLNGPTGVAVDGAGNVYFADYGNNATKEWLVASNTVITLVSSGLSHPFGVAVDVLGNVYIADAGHSAIQEWSATNDTVTTLVSSGLSSPRGVAVDGAGNVYIADSLWPRQQNLWVAKHTS